MTRDEEDVKFAEMAIAEAAKCQMRDGAKKPLVGAVLVKNGRVLGISHRGEVSYGAGDHAEYILLDRKLTTNTEVVGATLYTTLEPCTVRGTAKDGEDKIPCAHRTRDRHVSRVVIGMLDPNPDIQGDGIQLLQDAGIDVALFPLDQHRKVRDQNREFIREQRKRNNKPTSTENDADADLEVFENIKTKPGLGARPRERGEAVTSVQIRTDNQSGGSNVGTQNNYYAAPVAPSPAPPTPSESYRVVPEKQ
jgi:pyrimidine deaminase RibD-like protein